VLSPSVFFTSHRSLPVAAIGSIPLE